MSRFVQRKLSAMGRNDSQLAHLTFKLRRRPGSSCLAAERSVDQTGNPHRSKSVAKSFLKSLLR